ncbi:F0F1 ATP synthase subunit B' [Anthocerotibacter panamensis]|uniref:F0F1 ATP synthase subunit B' n=1 Tax=Anthocerotibacter panamensis TaxID=2857077 RepID=UPI001C4026A2|nr:F0F1 ATP synthase subunit B' [Anthocerotibacter panamensis]
MTFDVMGLLLLGAETAEAVGNELSGGSNFYCPAGLLCINGTLLFQAVNFLVLAVILNFVFYKPIQKVLEDRENHILSKRKEAQQRLEDARRMAEQYEAELVDTRREAQEIVAQAEAEATSIRNQRLAEVQAEAKARLELAQAEVLRSREEALAGLQSEIDLLSKQITSKLLTTAGRPR